MNILSTDIILHNYPQSPVAEKVRVGFGLKNLAWKSVEIPRLPPKPLLTELTGGYRRTPVMQIGADIYCDSQCIFRELERRHPTPTFTPGDNPGLLWCLSRWTDGNLFDMAVKIVLGSAGDSLPEDFAEDRGRLYFGPDWAAGLQRANAELPHWVAQISAPLNWVDAQLSDGRRFLLGQEPAAIDAQIYYVVWFIRGRWDQGPKFLSQFANLERWEHQVHSLGHGSVEEAAPKEAIQIAKQAMPSTEAFIDSSDPQGLQLGEEVTVQPDVNGGEQPVTGRIRIANSDTIALDRESSESGAICVHFPRAGYRVERL